MQFCMGRIDVFWLWSVVQCSDFVCCHWFGLMRQKKPSAVRWTCNAQRISLRSTRTLSFFCEHCHQTSWGDFHPSNPIHLQLMAWYQYEMAFCIDYCICRYLNNCHYCNRYLLHKGIGDAGSTADFKMLQNALVCYSLPWSAIVCLGHGLL